MRWYQKAGLSFVFGTGVLLSAVALFGACAPRWLGMGLAVLSVGVAALFANAPWLPGLLRRRAFRAVIRMRRGGFGAVAAARAALLVAVPDPVLLRRWLVPAAAVFVFFVLAVEPAWAAGPWINAVNELCAAFKNQIGKGLAVIAVIIGGLMFAFGEGGSKSAIAGLVFGAGMVLAAPGFLTWIGLTADC